MKKRLFLTLIVLFIAATAAFAVKGEGLAIGAEISSTNFNSWGGMLNLHIPGIPLHFAIGGYAGNGYSGFDLKVDYWLLHGNLASGFDWYVGLGGYFAAQLQPSSAYSLGARLPLALQFWPAGELIEIFFELAPAWIPFSNNGTALGNFVVQPAIGFRIWF
jgi:hypothetical protein